MSLISSFKGWVGEIQGALLQKLFLDAKVYHDFNNVTIETSNGTTQIDHIIVSQFGIFVIETKNINGWIYGGEKQASWTQNLYGKKYKFQNPLLQNYRHTKALAEFLGIDQSKIHSLVMFWSECEFKTPMPENVLNTGYTGYIKSKTNVLFTDEEVKTICEAISTGRLPKGWSTKTEHLKSLKERHASTTACPKCGGQLLPRTARQGKNAGSQFFGCANYPKCRYIADFGDHS
ncbi:MAG: nuclease [Deltaproteobacteria bacterium RBG_13_52_11]|nr:MAG: nuclease [Deltaproteobacteria bacterium RBG_13_52_11]